MKYVIHRYDYAYDDSFTINYGRTIYDLASFDSEVEARNYWANLERKSLKDDEGWISIREPLASYDYELAKLTRQKFEQALADYGFPLANDLRDTSKDWLYEKLNLDKLSDDQLLKLLCDCRINYYVVSAYTENDKVYLMNLGTRYLTYWNQGYVKTTGNTRTEYYVEVANPDDFFLDENFELDMGRYEPLATYYTQADKDNVLVQSLLKQYADVFIVFEDNIYFIGSTKEHPDFEDLNLDALKAMNAVLETPFYQIESYTPEQMLEMERLSQEKQLRGEYDDYEALPSFDRYCEYVRSLEPNYVKTFRLQRIVETEGKNTVIYYQELPVGITDDEIRERIRLPDTAWDNPETAPYMKKMLIEYLKSKRTVLNTTEIGNTEPKQKTPDLKQIKHPTLWQKIKNFF